MLGGLYNGLESSPHCYFCISHVCRDLTFLHQAGKRLNQKLKLAQEMKGNY